MHWRLLHANLLDQPADVLICSANPILNLSGGVGADLLNRYGQSLQDELRKYLSSRKLRYVQPCDVVPTFSGNTPYKVILHAVAIDAFYDTSAQWVAAATRKALEIAAEHGAKRVALAALATGYGRMPMVEFAEGLRPLLALDFLPIEEVVLCLRHADKVEELAAALPELAMS